MRSRFLRQRKFLPAFPGWLVALAHCLAVEPPQPFGPLLEFHGFMHFTVNTFTERVANIWPVAGRAPAISPTAAFPRNNTNA